MTAQIPPTSFDLGMLRMRQEEYHGAKVTFIRSNRITRWPTACAVESPGRGLGADSE